MMVDGQVQQVKQANDIVTVVGERVQLTKAGRNHKGLCPFHGEKTASFFVSSEMQTYKCFGCGVGGDIISFLEAYEGMTFIEALEYLANRAGITLVRRQPTAGEQLQDELMAILDLAGEYYHFLLTEHQVGAAARDYLLSRGVGKRRWHDFKLGYAAETWDGVQAFLVGKKRKAIEQVAQAGLVIPREHGGYYDRFRGRVIFPQYDFAGHIVGFAGRLMDPEIKQAKYINSPETRLYHKSKVLYGLYQNKALIRKADRVIVVEGEMDVLASVKAEVGEVVAMKGSALSEEQVLMLRRLTKNIYLALDADAAGQEAMKRAIQIGEKQGVQLRVVPMRGGKDPDEIVGDSPKKWREAVKESTSIYQFYIDWALATYDVQSGGGQKQISSFLAPILAQIENGVERAFYIKKLAKNLDVSLRVIETEVAKVAQPAQATTRTNEAPTEHRSRRERLERYVLGVALNLGVEAGRAITALKPEWFAETYLRNLLTQLHAGFGNDSKRRLSEVKQHLSQELVRVVDEIYGEDQALLALEPDELQHIFEKARDDLVRLQRREEMKRLSQQMGSMKEGDPLLVQIQAQYELLKREVTISG